LNGWHGISSLLGGIMNHRNFIADFLKAESAQQHPLFPAVLAAQQLHIAPFDPERFGEKLLQTFVGLTFDGCSKQLNPQMPIVPGTDAVAF
jgi:hypothetical protein